MAGEEVFVELRSLDIVLLVFYLSP